MNNIKTYLSLFAVAVISVFIFLFRLRGTKIEKLKDEVETGIKNLKVEKAIADNILDKEKIKSKVSLNDLKEYHKSKDKIQTNLKNIDDIERGEKVEIKL